MVLTNENFTAGERAPQDNRARRALTAITTRSTIPLEALAEEGWLFCERSLTGSSASGKNIRSVSCVVEHSKRRAAAESLSAVGTGGVRE